MERLETVTDSFSRDVGDLRVHSVKPFTKKPFSKCTNKEIGNCGEDLASFYVEHLGMEVIARNWRCKFGEVDIVAQDEGDLVLIEVKTRVSHDGSAGLIPESAVSYRKRVRYEKLALMYLSRQSRADTARFDVVAVQLLGEQDALMRYFRDAFETGRWL